MLHWRKHDYEVHAKSPNYHAQKRALPLWKHNHPELGEVQSQVLQNIAKRVDLALEAFFRRVKRGETPGYPRYKGVGHYDSITYPQSGFTLGEDAVTLSKIGTLKAV